MEASTVTSTTSSSHDLSSSAASSPEEFYVTVELYLSKTAVAARKSQIPRKKTEKRESVRTSTSYGDLHQRKIKEKASWLSLSRNSNLAEEWRGATCKFTIDKQGCTLNVYLDSIVLYQSIYIHRLNHTDIRLVHHSLLDRKDCLGIFSSSQQPWHTTPLAEPTYLHFSDTETLNTWLVLLRSYATPEIYGRGLSRADGGLYRMWRQVELVCLQGRNLGLTRSCAAADDSSPADGDGSDAVDSDIYCEIYVNAVVAGKTTVKRTLGSPDWHEKFAFTDLPPFGNLEVLVYREKRLAKSILIGSTVIPLMNFRRGEYVEGWFPVLGGQGYIGAVMGEVRLKIKVDEEIILPFAMYADMLGVLQSKNLLDWIADLDTKLEVKNVSEHVIAVAKAKNCLVKNIMELADREVDGTPQSHGILFRGNTVFTKTMEHLMVAQGSAFLEASVGSVIRRLCTAQVAIEIDPARNHKKNIEKQTELLVYWCREFWNSIYDARKQCPEEMRRLFSHIRHLIEERYNTGESQNKDLPWQGVSSFLFLRFFVPAILHPHLFGIWPGLTEDSVQRTLTLVAKVMQSLANLNTTLQKETYMRAVQDFLTNSSSGMIEYIATVSTTQETQPTQASQRHERLRIMNTLNQKRRKSPLLGQEAISLLPYMIDLPKHLAAITSVVVRHTRRPQPARPAAPAAAASVPTATEPSFEEFCSSCLQVEEQALRRVSQLASRRRAHSIASPSSPSFLASPPSSPPPALPPVPRKSPTPNKLRSKKFHRPGTAPGPVVVAGIRTGADPDSRDSSEDVSLQSSPLGSKTEVVSVLPVADAHSASCFRCGPSTGSGEGGGEPQSMPAPRPAFMHHPRSSSTDSALARKQAGIPRSPSMPTSGFPYDVASSEAADEPSRKPRGLLRGILRR